MDVVAVVALARSVEEEAPLLAAELGVTAYEAGVMLRAPSPIVLLRTEDRARALDVLGRLRARGHEAVACDLAAVVSSDAMFQPRSFRFEGSDFIGVGAGQEQRLALPDALAFIRALHVTRTEDTVVDKQRKLNLASVGLTGGLIPMKTKTTETTRVTQEREPVLYLYRNDGVAWLLRSSDLRYDGLGAEMKPSQVENFEVLLARLRALAPTVPFDTRLLAAKAAPSILATASSKHLSSTTAGTIDLLAHLVALAIRRTVRPYR